MIPPYCNNGNLFRTYKTKGVRLLQNTQSRIKSEISIELAMQQTEATYTDLSEQIPVNQISKPREEDFQRIHLHFLG